MVKKNGSIQNSYFFDSVFVSPVVFMGCFAAASFYIFCLFENSFSFLVWSLSAAALPIIYIFFCCFQSGLFKKPCLKNTKFVISGILIGYIAFLHLLIFNAPFSTLAETAKIDSVRVCLKGEPLPAGKKYYAVHAKLLSCRYKTGSEFSMHGNIKVFIPSGIITQNNAGSVSLYKSSKKNAGRVFAEGVTLSIRGRFALKKKKTEPVLFFADPEIPEFLGWRSPFSAVRARLRFALMHLLAGWGAAGGLALALLSANRDFLEGACASAFRNAGLAHILALSGMHISLVSLAAIQAGAVFGKKSRAVTFSLFAIIFFVWFAGSAPSLNRALGMMIILMLGKALGLRPSMFSVLNAMLVLHLLFKPEEALNLGFMLSYGALAGILLFGSAISEILCGKIPPKLLGGISASLAAQAFTAPVVISKIGILAPIGIIASIILSPLISLFLILGMAGIFISLLIPQTAPIFSYVLNSIYTAVLVLARLFAHFPQINAESIMQKLLFSAVPFAAGVFFMYYAETVKRRRGLLP